MLTVTPTVAPASTLLPPALRLRDDRTVRNQVARRLLIDVELESQLRQLRARRVDGHADQLRNAHRLAALRDRQRDRTALLRARADRRAHVEHGVLGRRVVEALGDLRLELGAGEHVLRVRRGETFDVGNRDQRPPARHEQRDRRAARGHRSRRRILANHAIERNRFARFGPHVGAQTRGDDRLLRLHRTAVDEARHRDVLARSQRPRAQVTDDARHDQHQRKKRYPAPVERRRHRLVERRDAVAERPVGRGRRPRRRRWRRSHGTKARRRRVAAGPAAETHRGLLARLAQRAA